MTSTICTSVSFDYFHSMAYLKKYSEPVEKGQYWRPILNTYKECEPYTLDVVVSLLKNIDANNKMHIKLPFSVASINDVSELIHKNQIYPMDVAINFFNNFNSEIKKAYKFIISNPNKIKEQTFEFHHLSENVKNLALASIGYRSSKIKDQRNIDLKIRDYWFLGGFAQYVADIEKYFFAHLGLMIPDSAKPEKMPINFYERIIPGGQTTKTAKWSINNFEGQASSKMDKESLSLYINSMRFCASCLIPLGELEVFRRLAIKTWNDSKSKGLDPVEILTLHKYVALSRLEIDISNPAQAAKSPFELREKRSFWEEHERLGHWGYFTVVGGDHLSSLIGRIVANTYLDFWDELNYFNIYDSYKGSFECRGCGRIIPRSFDAYGQKYCTVQCKKLAAKNRYKKKKGLRGRAIS